MTPPLCRVYTDEGIHGDGEVALSYGGASRAAFGMLQDLARHLIGMGPLELKLFGSTLYQKCFWDRNGGTDCFWRNRCF